MNYKIQGMWVVNRGGYRILERGGGVRVTVKY